jgi:hypothetical protein
VCDRGPPAAEVLQGFQNLRRQLLHLRLAAAPTVCHHLCQGLPRRQLLQGGTMELVQECI